MARGKDYNYNTGDKMPRSPGDSAYYEESSGFTHPVTGMSNHITGTPREPDMRGDTHAVGSEKFPKGSAPRDNGVLRSFYMEKD